MSTLTASMSPIVNAAPMAQSSPTAPPADNGFARRLDQAREHHGAEQADEAARRSGTRKPPSNTRAERDAHAARAAGRAATPPKADSETEAPTDTATAHATARSVHDDSTAPDLAALLPGWAPVPASALAAAAAADDNAPLQTGAALGGANGANGATALSQDAATARSLALLGNADESAAIPIAPGAELQAAVSEQRIEAPDLRSALLPTTLQGAPAAATTNTFRTADAPPTTAVLPAPIDSPAFAPSLATQVRWWAGEGVQQAQLLLNPTEMGPVTVKIVVLDGREARIDFSADLAATRGAIEAALPVLAAALDEGGLKLTGGGVHDGSAQRQPTWSAHDVTHRTAAGATSRDDEHVTRLAATPARGIVDLMA